MRQTAFLGLLVLAGSMAGAMPAAAAGAPGRLDPAFGSGGIVVADLGGSDDAVHGVVVGADGAITVVGEARRDDRSLRTFAAARFHPDGTADPGFGRDGRVHTGFGESLSGGANAAVIDADGRLIVAGSSANPEAHHETFALARYLPDGRLDRTFGRKGLVLTAIDTETGAGRADIARAVALDADGRILVAGETGSFLHDIAVARYLSDGSLDRSFGRKGVVTVDLGGDDRANAIAVAADGSIVVAGSGWTDGPDEDMVVLRLGPDGAPDPGFGTDGTALVDFRGGADRAFGLAVRPTGEIVVGGVAQLSGGCSPSTCERYGFGVAQLTPAGVLDPAFGDGGRLQPDFLTSSGGYALTLLADGTVAVAGHIGNEDLGLLFVDPTGAPIPVADGEALRIDIAGGPDRAWGIAAAPDGTVVLAGDTQDADLGVDAALVRFVPPTR